MKTTLPWSGSSSPLYQTKRIGRILLGFGILGSGIQQEVTGHFVRLVPQSTLSIELSSGLPYLVGGVLICCGAMTLLDAKTRFAAWVFGVLLFASICFQHVPLVVANPQLGYVWTNPLKALALVGAMVLLLVAPAPASAAESTAGFQWRRTSEILGRISLAVFFLVCGAQHFVYANFASSLVPKWLPAPMIWTYFTGVALLAGGTGLLLSRFALLAGVLSGIMIFLWVIMLHLPRALSDLSQAGEMSSVFEALALSGAAFLAAGAGRARFGNGLQAMTIETSAGFTGNGLATEPLYPNTGDVEFRN